ncbi:MAG: hypothetical protein U1C48_01600 [Methylotenera sp.]|nr:hypothetical protein [Methylotenera sp.]
MILIVGLSLPPARHFLEADMRMHMLVQFPLLIIAGVWIGLLLPNYLKIKLSPYHSYGITGLLIASSVTSFWMIPLALDEVLVLPSLEIAKFISLLVAGVALAISWRAAGFLIQGFFLANVLPMMTVVGWLYLAAPLRLCNAYLSSQQESTGLALVYLSILVIIVWLMSFFVQGQKTDAVEL